MVHTALNALLDALSWLAGLAVPLAITLGALLLALLLVGLLDRERFRAGLNWAGSRLPGLGHWVLVALAVGAGALVTQVTRRAVDVRLGAQLNARYANAADPAGGQTVQSAPRVSLLTTRTYSRSLVLPADVYARLNLNGGWETLLPYFGNPPGLTVQDLREGFTRRGRNLIYTRDVTLQTEEPLGLDTTRARADLRFVDPAGGRGTYYNATFTADYAFTNPRKEAAPVRFVFPLPYGSGTLSGFRLTVNGQSYRASDLREGSVWEGVVPAGQTVRVNVTYRHQGSRGWSYNLSDRREPLRNLDLTVTADRPAKFERYSLYPTSITRSAFGGVQTLRWQLQDVITAQNVAVVFAQGSVREMLAKVGLMEPLALLVATLLASVWALLRHLPLPPLRLAGAVLGLAVGFALGGVLTAYLPPVLAVPLGSLVGLVFGVLALGRAYLPPLIVAALIPLAFLAVGHSGLLLTLLAAVTLLVGLRAWGRPRRTA
ncbi:hypothetical protein E5F05_08955 [Deinococcus metallilatus]|uniref:Uncharacterized protein n=1 Tax=Deinococcus metallilatus TaxID=1211322 RepID=A0AAJ5F4R8_9DEIO|nr:hypothetical protein [Deinococcus metallilatus]MBB5295409.1 hypothetical protein [Deinococcus metallilatus]QBY08063.1 hypothetical protein E5F05_08955 [Deinococcus metallilatus]RXJ12956.1 hypothetical protein ERJ73_07780 [Deinococcus metallilatus]TLK27122.1 hypothetical protein FCS05_09535 [Deinococcus metallilatus]GMA16086.1 hypothetical protein GCM10025871_24170 [Deinococcus metallilatus]